MSSEATLYVIDIDQPDARISKLLWLAGAVVTVTDVGRRIVTLVPTITASILYGSPVHPQRQVHQSTGRYPSCLVFTSGSTGTPKGVVLRRADWMARSTDTSRKMRIAPNGWIMLTSTPSFDAFMAELTVSMASSCGIITFSMTLKGDATYRCWLTNVYCVEAIPIAVPSFAIHWFADPMPTVTDVLLGGEAVTGGLCRLIADSAADNVRCWNGYGPAECTAHVTLKLVSGVEQPRLGLAAAGSHVALLGSTGHVINPPGGRGELVASGIGLADCYLGDARRTTVAFAPSPMFSKLPGAEARAYHTGDIGMWTDGSELLYQGRRDYQLKIRGQRVEIGEVEGTLARFSSALAVAVVACPHPSDPKQKMLVAFVSGGGATDAISELRLSASSTLPSHMLPSRFVALPELPRGATGKIDRKRLVGEATDRFSIGALESSPSTSGHVAHGSSHPSIPGDFIRCWRDVLNVGRVDPSQTFFDAGGDSISAIRLVSEIRSKYPSLSVTVKDVFDFPTISALWKKLGQDGGAFLKREHSSTLPPTIARLARAWESVLGIHEVEPTTNFFDIGGDSILAMRLVSKIRQEFPESTITVEDVVEYATLSDMVHHVDSGSDGSVFDEVEVSNISQTLMSLSDTDSVREEASSPALTKLRGSRSKMSVVCFPGLGWLGGEFSDFVALSHGYNVFVANGPESGEQLQSLVERLGQEVARRTDMSVVLLGHSMGGLVASKVGQYIRDTTGHCVDVVVIDTHRAVPLSHVNVHKTVDQLLGQSGMVSLATRKRFTANVHLMNEWVERQELDVSCNGATSIEAGESRAENRRVKVEVESTFHVPGADHVSILKWPHVLNVVQVVRHLFEKETAE